jgi:hypothetical protein
MVDEISNFKDSMILLWARGVEPGAALSREY